MNALQPLSVRQSYRHHCHNVYYGAFTLPDTKTDTGTDKLTQNQIGICADVCLCAA